MRTFLEIVMLGVVFAFGTASAEPLPFEIQNGRGAAGLVFTIQADPSQATKWSRLVRITAVGEGAQSTENLRIASPLLIETESGDGTEVKTKFDSAKQSLAAGASIPLELTGEFKAPGVYRGELLLVQAPRQRVVPIQVTVSAGKPTLLPIQEYGGKTIAATGPAPSILAIRLRNTGTEPIDVKPSFTSVARIDKPESPTYQIAVPAANAVGERQTIQPGDVGRFDLTIKDLDEPGIYTVDTVIANPAGKYLSQSVKSTVYRRDTVWLAVAWIAIGALLAWLIRWYVSDGNKRMGLRRRIALLSEQIRLFRTDAHIESIVAAARVLELDVEDRHRDVRWGGKIEDIEKIIARAELRFALLRECTTALQRMEQIDAGTQAQARKTLDTALALVRVDPDKNEKVEAARQSILDLGLDGVRREQARARLAELREQIDIQMRTGSAELRESMLKIRQSLTEADYLDRTDKLKELEQLIELARDSMLDSCVEELERLAQSQTPPVGVTKGKWRTTVAELQQGRPEAKARLGWADRLRALQAAQRTYFSTAVEGLITEAIAKADAKDSRATQLREIAAELRALLDKKDVDAAAKLYSSRASIVTAPDPNEFSRDLVGDESSEGKPARGWFPLQLLPPNPVSGERPEPESAVQHQRAIQSWGWLVNLAVLIIAVTTGVKTLWLDNLAWGGSGACLLAFLWGAGVQVTGDAFTGLVGLRAKLGGLTTPL